MLDNYIVFQNKKVKKNKKVKSTYRPSIFLTRKQKHDYFFYWPNWPIFPNHYTIGTPFPF